MRTVREQQLYRDLAPDMVNRDRRLRVLGIGDDGRAECLVEHDLQGTTARKARIQTKALASAARFELLDDADDLGADARYTALLAAIANVHGPAATPRDYARAAWDALGLSSTQAPGRRLAALTGAAVTTLPAMSRGLTTRAAATSEGRGMAGWVVVASG